MSTAHLPALLRRAAALSLLAPYGIGDKDFEKAVAAGVIERITFPGGTRGYYATAQLRRVFIEPAERHTLTEQTNHTHH